MTLSTWDYVCIFGYLALIIVVGGTFARQQKTSRDYFLAGKSMRWLPLAISMYATLFSAISYVMAPAEAFRHDLQYLVALILFPIASLLAIILFIDVFVRLNITTVFEYLEARFSGTVAFIMLGAYVVFRCLYAGIVVYTLSLVLHVTMGFPLQATMVGVGIGAVIYTTLGGIKAVIWTDVIQFFIMFGGLVVALAYAIGKLPGGLSEAYHTAAEAGKLRLVNTEFDLTQRYVVWTLIPYGLVDFLGTKGVDQMNVQRFLSARSSASAKLAMLVQSCFTLPVWLLLFGVGMGLFAYYTRFP